MSKIKTFSKDESCKRAKEQAFEDGVVNTLIWVGVVIGLLIAAVTMNCTISRFDRLERINYDLDSRIDKLESNK